MSAFQIIDASAATGAPAIGTACDTPGGGLAYIVAVRESAGNTYTLFGGPSPMSPDKFTLTIASEAGHVSEISENIAAPMIERARHVPPIGGIEAAALLERAKVKQADNRRTLSAENEAREAKRKASSEELATIAPPWAVAAIVAELHEDASDYYSDYHNHRTARMVVIGWSKHKRDLFPEMRKCAATFPETADLATAPESAEHREKYSMGAGFYLKQGGRDSSEWCVKKSAINWLTYPGLEFSDDARAWAVLTGKVDQAADPITEPEAPAPTVADSGRFTVSQHTHSKKGFAMTIASLPGRVERSEFDRLLSEAKALGGWYSRPWGGTPGGFAFKDNGKALAFIASNGGEG